MKKLLHTATIVSTLAAALASAPAWAQTAAVKVEGAWARASVQGQKGTGAFMRLTAQEGARLVRAESPAAGLAEVHEIKMEGDVMKMRALPQLELKSGQKMAMQPGSGVHIMLMGLKKPLAVGDTFPLTLNFRKAGKIDITVSVVEMGMPMKKKDDDGDMHHHHHHD